MKFYYSHLQGQFYTGEAEELQLPEDAQELTQEEYTTLVAGLSQGKFIVMDGGRPVLLSPIRHYYSASTGGFYVSNIHGANMPGDVVEISQEKYNGLLEAHSTGKVIAADANGAPVAVDFVPTADQLHTMLVAQAEEALLGSDVTYLRCAKAGVQWPPAWQLYVVALRAIVSGTSPATEIPTRPEYPAGA